MNKKAYIKPTMEVTTFISEVIMNAGSANSGINVVSGSFDSSTDEQYGNKSRGSWGNLWGEE